MACKLSAAVLNSDEIESSLFIRFDKAKHRWEDDKTYAFSKSCIFPNFVKTKENNIKNAIKKHENIFDRRVINSWHVLN